MLDDFCQACRRQNQTCTRWRIPPRKLRSAAPWNHRQPGLIRKPQDFCQLALRSRLDHQLRLHSDHGIRGRRRPRIPATGQGNEFVAQRRVQAARFGFGCGIHRRPSVTLRDPRRFGRVRHVFTGFFTAQPRRRKNFRGIRKLQWIERAAHSLHRFQVGLGKHF